MAPATAGRTPSLATFSKSLKQHDVATSIELFISLLKRRQIRNSRPCAVATAQLLLRVVASERTRDAQTLIQRIREVGSRLVAAQPREWAVGNIVRRILGVVREVAEDEQAARAGGTNESASPGSAPSNSAVTSPFDLFRSQTGSVLPTILPDAVRASTKAGRKGQHGTDREKLDIKAEVIDGIKELLDELEVVDSQIADSALSHIHEGDRIITQGSSQTVQKFLMTAAKKRKFTVFHAEAYPNDHEATHATIANGGKKSAGDEDDADERWKPLTSVGIKVVLIPDQAVFALMHKMDKVLLAPHSIFADGSFVGVSGASTITQAAKNHSVPVVALGGVYKLSPVYPMDPDSMIEYGSPENVVPYEDGHFMENVEVVNPLFDWIAPDFVRLYITNIGGYTPGSIFRIVDEHYSAEDLDLSVKRT